MSDTQSACAACGRPVAGRPLCESCDRQARSSYVHVSGDASGSYDPALFAVLEELEPRSFWFRARNRLIISALEAHFGAEARFLEVGCGTGFVLAAIREELPGFAVMGAELYPAGLEAARRRLDGVPLVQMDVLDVRFAATFDVVGAFDVLEHIVDDEAALRGLCRAVRPGGGLVVTVPQHPRLWSAADEFAGHVRRYTRGELIAKAERTGWVPLRCTSFVTLPLPLLMLSRLVAARGTYDFERELTLPRRVDQILERLMALERYLIGSRLSLPVGGSLLLVARRGR